MRLFQAPAGSIYAENPSQVSGRLCAGDVALTFGHTPQALDAYFTHYYLVNPYRRAATLFRTPRPLTNLPEHLSLLPDADGYDEFFQDWARPQGLNHLIGQFLQTGTLHHQALVLWRDRGAFSVGEQDEYNRIARAVRRALANGNREAQAQAALQQAGRSQLALVTIADDGRASAINQAAEDLLRRADVLHLVHNRLRTVRPDDQVRLDRLLAERSGSGDQGSFPDSIVLHGRDRRRVLTMSIVRAPRIVDGLLLDPTRRRLLLIQPGEASAIRTGGYGLTPSERRVAEALTGGGSLRDVACRLGVSYETARAQLKAVFAKTGARRQSELVALLLRMED